MTSPSFLPTDAWQTLKQTAFQDSTDRDLWSLSFKLNSESHIAGLSSLLDPPADSTPTPLAAPELAPLPVEVSPQAGSEPQQQGQQQGQPDQQPASPPSVLGSEFDSWRPPTLPSGSTAPDVGGSGSSAAAPQASAGTGDLESYARSEAARLGIDPDTAVRVANTEGGFTDPTRQNTGGAPAYGPYQAYIGGPSNPGLGDEMLQQGIDPRKPEDARRAITYSLEHAVKNGWGAFQGAAANGIGSWEGVRGTTQGVSAPTAGGGATSAAPAAAPTGAQAAAPSAGWEVDQAALDDPDKWSLCGPVAAVMAAGRRGANWTVGQAKQIAVESGLWNAAQGMGGLTTEVDLLKRLGVSATTGVADVQHLAADALAGNTPIISTVKHYFILKGYDPSTGKFDTTTSGSVLRGGSRYLTLDQIAALGGGIQGAAYMDNPTSPAPSAVAPPTAPAAGPPTAVGAAPAPAGEPPAPAGAPTPDNAGWSPDAPAQPAPAYSAPAGRGGGGGVMSLIQQPKPAGLPYDSREQDQGPHEWRPEWGDPNYALDEAGRPSPGAPAPGSWPGDDQNPNFSDNGQPAPGPAPRTPINGVPVDAMYRQPLAANSGPDTATGDQPSNPDQGPHELVPAPQSTYNDPESGGTQSQPLPPYAPSQDAVEQQGRSISQQPVYSNGTRMGDVVEGPAAPVSPYDNGPPDAVHQTDPGATQAPSPLKPVFDMAGRVIGYVHEQAQNVARQINPVQPGASYTDTLGQGLTNVGQGLTPGGQTPAQYVQTITPSHDTRIAPEAAVRDVIDAPTNLPNVLPAANRAINETGDSARPAFQQGAQEWSDGQIGQALYDLGRGTLDVANSPFAVGQQSIDAALPTMANGPISMGTAVTNLSLIHDVRSLVNAGIQITPKVVAALRNGTSVEDLLGIASRGLNSAANTIDSGIGAARGIGSRLAEGRQVAAEANAADAGSRTYGVIGPAPLPGGGETRIPGAGYHTDLSQGAEQMIRADVERNAPQEVVHRADVAQKAQDVLGLDPETVQRWQAEATAAAPEASAVRGEALRQARDIDAESASRAIDRLQAAQRQVRVAGGADNLNEQQSADVATALLDAAEAARGMQSSGAADSASARAAARELNQRKSAITAQTAMQTAERARQVGQDAAFAARDVQQTARTGQVTPQGAARLQTLRDKLLEAERHGLTGDGAGGRLDALEQQAAAPASTTAAVAIGPAPGVRRGAGLGTRVATDVGNSILGAGTGAVAGYNAPAATEEDRRRHALLLAGAGAISFPLVGRVLRDGGGLRAMLGPVPTPELPNRSLAMGADPAKRYEFRYRVADLGDLVSSNLPTGAPNPAFPSELQPRARGRAASQLQIGQIAQNLDPVALLHDAGRLDSGPPIVGADNLVESGNGRTLALAKAAQDHPERYQAYVQTLKDNLGEFGLSGKDLEGVQHPVLVRERLTPVDRPAFVAEANGATTLRMSPAEQAAQSAANLSDEVVTQLHVGEGDSIAQALRRTENRDLVRQWIGTIPENERAGLLDAQGNIAPHGYDALSNALLTRTYGEGATTRAFIEAGDPGVRSVQNAVMGSLPDMARAEALIRSGQRDAGLSIASDVAGATEVLARLKQAGMSVGDYVRQVALGDRELTPFQESLLQFLDQNQRRPAAIRSALREYAGVVENAADPNQIDMFGNAVAGVTKEDAWQAATAQTGRETALAQSAPVYHPAGEATPTGQPIDIPPSAPSPVSQQAPIRPGPVADIVPRGGPEGRLEAQGGPQSVGARPGALPEGVAPAGGPESTLQRQGAPALTPAEQAQQMFTDQMRAKYGASGWSQRMTPAEEARLNVLNDASDAARARTPAGQIVPQTGGPEGSLAVEGAPPEPANLPPVAQGSLPAGGPATDLTLSSGRSVKDVAGQIDQVLANPNAPGAVERLQQLHRDLQEISAQGFSKSSQIKQRLQQQGLLRLGLSKSTSNEDVTKLVQALANVDPAHPEQMHAVLNIISKPRLIDRLMEYQYVNMLSSPITQGVNITANAMQIAGRLLLQNPLESLYSGGRSTGAGAAFGGAVRGFREALPDVKQIMRTGTSPGAINRAAETGNYSRVGRELLTEQFGQAGAVLHMISTRPLEAMDTLLGHMAYASAADQYAQRTADRLLAAGSPKVAGMSREAARGYVMSNIWDYPDVIAKAGRIQDYTLLKSNDASQTGLGIVELRLRQMAGLGHAPADADFPRQVVAFAANNVMPFFNVPLNTAKQGIERTAGAPVNAIRALRAYGQGDVEKGAELASKATIGAAAITTAGMLAAGDNLTGEGPGGPQQAIWEQDHRRNSFRVPGTQTWVTWEGTPLAIPFGMVAGAKQGWQDASHSAEQKGQGGELDRYGAAGIKAAQGAVQGFTSQSFIRAMGDQYKLLTGQETGLGTIANQATSNVSRFMPASGMVNFLAGVTDSMQRDPGRPQSFSDLGQNIAAREAMRIPGAREQVDTRFGPYGRPLPNEQSGVAGLLPYYRGAGPGANDPVNKVVETAGVGAIPAPPEVPAGVTAGPPIPLSMAQQRVFTEAAGTRFRELLDANNVGAGGFSPRALDHFRTVARDAGVAAALAAMDPTERAQKVQAALRKKAS